MKRLSFTLLCLSFLFTAVNAQTAEEIISKHVEAIGGADAWKKVSGMKMEGTLKMQGRDIAISRTVLHEKGQRQDISVAGMSGYNIITPTAGWNFMPFQGQTQPEAMPDEEVKENQSELDAQDELVDYKEKGTAVELIGKDDVEGTECYKLSLTFKSGKTATLFIDPASYLTIRQISKQKANGQETEVTTDFSNYKKLPEGILVPMSISLPFGELNITKVEVNGQIDESIFKPSN